MATTKFIESGSAATQSLGHWDSSTTNGGATITSSSQAILTSVRSIAAFVNTTFEGASVAKNTVLADAGRRISFGFRFSGTLSDTTGADFCVIRTSGGGAIFDLTLNSSGNIKLIKASDGSTYGTGSTVLAANTDYRISIVYTVTSTTINTITVYVNGLSEIAVTNVTLPATGTSQFILGQGLDNGVNSGTTFYFAHIYVDDGTSGDPGNIRVTAKRPFANGTTNGFTTQIGSGNSGYGSGHADEVNERPNSDSNGWAITTVASAITEEYNIESVSQGDIDITGATIVDYTGWLRTKALTAETAQIIVNNSASNISITSSIVFYTKIAGSSTYPAGTGTDIGEISAAIATTISLYEAGIIVAYIPAVASTAVTFITYRPPWRS